MILTRQFFFLGKQQPVVTVIVAQFLISAAVLKVVKEAPAAVCFTVIWILHGGVLLAVLPELNFHGGIFTKI